MQLSPKEISVIQLALDAIIEELTNLSKDQKIPLTPEARMLNRDILITAKYAHQKIAAVSGKLIKMHPYKPGDEQEFLTKES